MAGFPFGTHRCGEEMRCFMQTTLDTYSQHIIHSGLNSISAFIYRNFYSSSISVITLYLSIRKILLLYSLLQSMIQCPRTNYSRAISCDRGLLHFCFLFQVCLRLFFFLTRQPVGTCHVLSSSQGCPISVTCIISTLTYTHIYT